VEIRGRDLQFVRKIAASSGQIEALHQESEGDMTVCPYCRADLTLGIDSLGAPVFRCQGCEKELYSEKQIDEAIKAVQQSHARKAIN